MTSQALGLAQLIAEGKVPLNLQELLLLESLEMGLFDSYD